MSNSRPVAPTRNSRPQKNARQSRADLLHEAPRKAEKFGVNALSVPDSDMPDRATPAPGANAAAQPIQSTAGQAASPSPDPATARWIKLIKLHEARATILARDREAAKARDDEKVMPRLPEDDKDDLVARVYTLEAQILRSPCATPHAAAAALLVKMKWEGDDALFSAPGWYAKAETNAFDESPWIIAAALRALRPQLAGPIAAATDEVLSYDRPSPPDKLAEAFDAALAAQNRLADFNEPAAKRTGAIVEQILDEPVRTLDDIILRARAARWVREGQACDFDGDETTDIRLAEQIVDGLIALAERAKSPIASQTEAVA